MNEHEATAGERVHNTSVLLSPEGELAAVYRKIHLFDVDLRGRGGSEFRESSRVAPGSEVVVAKTPFGGLGLSICKEFVELHGGEIWASSAAGGGCTFTFTMPLTDARLPNQRLNPPAPERHRVLLVEDEPEVAMVTSEMLRSRYRVEVARDGAEGIAKARTIRPDLIVMDVVMPGRNGFQACRDLKNDDRTKNVPIVLCTSKGNESDKFWGSKQGADQHIPKPFTPEQVTEVIRKFVG